MLYITGDTHGSLDLGKLNMSQFPQQRAMTRDDIVMICGDFGLVWNDSPEDLRGRQWLSEKNFTTLWVDGNHENFHLLHQYPTEERFGGRVRKIVDGVYHLERGHVFTIQGKKFFCMGGARSTDKAFRTENISWWREEMPSFREYGQAWQSLEDVGWKVDYVVTHCAPTSVAQAINPYYEKDALTEFFEDILDKLSFDKWYFGHYHTDQTIDGRFVALYNRVIPIGKVVTHGGI